MSIVDTIAGFAQGADPTAVRLILGTFEFLDFEVPEQLSVPGEQKVAKHLYPGGKKSLDVLGEYYDTLSWSGIIQGENCGDRVAALEAIRAAGNVVTLTFDTYSFQVLVTRFTPVYKMPMLRPYSIEVEVLSRNDAPIRVDALTGSLNALVNSDVGKALGLSDIINVSSITDAVKTVQSAVKTVSDFAHATVSEIQTVVRPIVAAQQLISQQISSLESSASAITTLGGLVPGNPITNFPVGSVGHADTSADAVYPAGMAVPGYVAGALLLVAFQQSKALAFVVGLYITYSAPTPDTGAVPTSIPPAPTVAKLIERLRLFSRY